MNVTKSGNLWNRTFHPSMVRPFQALAFWLLISMKNRSSHPLIMEQIAKEVSPSEKPIIAKESCPKKAKRGRPKGSSKKDVELSTYLRFVQTTLKSLLQIVGTDLSLVYFGRCFW